MKVCTLLKIKEILNYDNSTFAKAISVNPQYFSHLKAKDPEYKVSVDVESRALAALRGTLNDESRRPYWLFLLSAIINDPDMVASLSKSEDFCEGLRTETTPAAIDRMIAFLQHAKEAGDGEPPLVGKEPTISDQGLGEAKLRAIESILEVLDRSGIDFTRFLDGNPRNCADFDYMLKVLRDNGIKRADMRLFMQTDYFQRYRERRERRLAAVCEILQRNRMTAEEYLRMAGTS